MRLLYLPAIVRDVVRSRGVRPSNWLDPRLRGTRAYYPHVLTSYPFWRGQQFAWDEDQFIFGDSGGFSQFSRGIRLNPVHVIRWQLRHCAVGVLLDTPVGPPQFRRPFRDCLARSVADTQAALPTYLRALDAGTSFRWWGIAHGRTMFERAEWFDAIRRVYAFDRQGEGWAVKPDDQPEAVAEALEFLQECGIRRAHFFARTGQLIMETLIALGPAAGLELLTVDSSTPITSANKGNLFISKPGGWGFLRGEDARRTHMLACPCVSCDYLRQDLNEDAELENDQSYWLRRLKFHNVLVMLRAFDQLKERYHSVEVATTS